MGPSIAYTPDVIVCGLHLRWTGVWQRPHHILSRLARFVPVIVVEEPDGQGIGAPAVVRHGDVTVITPHRRPSEPQIVGDDVKATVRSLTAAMPNPLLWLYSPMMLPLVDVAGHAPIVYDKMDELAAFAGADPRMAAFEEQLLSRARAVFAGGRSLFESVRDRCSFSKCYPSGVDVHHFRRSDAEVSRPSSVPHDDKPVFGYIGVIDERIDLALIADLADAYSEATILMVGPVTKIDEAELPKRPNVVYHGRAAYDELPSILATFDVALMPFARNEHTENISPTKTLEYLAAGKPVVSTAIPDVVRDFSEAVVIARNARDFIRAIAVAQCPDADRRAAAEAKLATASWDGIVCDMSFDLSSLGIEFAGSLRRPEDPGA